MIPRLPSQPTRSGFQVLNHGDLINNMLFKNDEKGNPIDVKFIDFQLSFWGSPIADLMYFLLTSVRDEIKTAHFDELIAFYHKELIKSLKELKYCKDAPTLDVLKQDLMEKRGFSKRLRFCDILFLNECFFTVHGIFIHALMMAKYDSDQEFDLQSFMGGTLNAITLEKMYRNEIYLKALQCWLPFFENRGLLDQTY